MSLQHSTSLYGRHAGESSTSGPQEVKKKRKASVSSSDSDLSMTTQLKAKKKRKSDAAKLFVMGSNDMGQLGLGADVGETNKPKVLKGLLDKDIVDIACGGIHALALASDGTVFSWGCNDEGALGRATPNEEDYTPGVVEGLEGVQVTKIAAGDSVSLALGDKGQVFFWGAFRDQGGVIELDTDKTNQLSPILVKGLEKLKIEAIACGNNHCLAMASNGGVYAWGASNDFQLGRSVGERRKAMQLVPSMVFPKMHAELISAGGCHSFALTKKNKLLAWGLNGSQQCGLMPNMSSKPMGNYVSRPKEIKTLPNGDIVSVQGGNHHSLVLMNSGYVYSFGRAGPPLGLPKEQIEELQAIKDSQDTHESQETQATHEFQDTQELASQQTAMREGGDVMPKEKDVETDKPNVASSSQASPSKDMEGVEMAIDEGKKPATDKPKPKHKKKTAASKLTDIGVPVRIPDLENVVSIACGGEHSLAVLNDGTCYAWGHSDMSQLGQGDDKDRQTSVLITSNELKDLKVIRADAGAAFTMLLAE
ncbi:regulator of chromosome condensation 1/beta-lactamase-inhibitor protein II [Gongronella butleri]|nr:regulator of chromosome condensation 1/beta-lactamase-inhibitor protein II [Gongronella butleri]